MWTLKIKGREKNNIYEERAVKYKIKIYFYSHNYYEDSGCIFLIGSGIIEGKEESKLEFIKDLRKDSRIVNLETNGNYFLCVYSEKKNSVRGRAIKSSYNPKFIFLKPAIIDETGWEHWEIASPDKKALDEVISESEKLENFKYKILKFKQEKINNLMIYSTMPNLTRKQKEALSIAINKGYYGYPRKVNLSTLAQESKISLSTFHFHLSKAEQKIFAHLSDKL